jgi:hypothetical protein
MPYTDAYYCCTNVYLDTAAMLCTGRRVTIITKSGPASMLQAQLNFDDLVRQREEDGAYSAEVHTRRLLSSYDNNWGLSRIPGAQAMIDELDTEYSGTLKIITDIPVSVYTYLSVYVYT